MENNYTSVLEECIKVATERQSQYGEAIESLKKCSDILKSLFNIDLSVDQLCNVMVALKFSRQSHLHKEDSILDIINYLSIGLYSKRQSK